MYDLIHLYETLVYKLIQMDGEIWISPSMCMEVDRFFICFVFFFFDLDLIDVDESRVYSLYVFLWSLWSQKCRKEKVKKEFV